MGGNLFLNEIISTFNMFNECSKFLLRNFDEENMLAGGTGKARQENCDFFITRALEPNRKIHYIYTLKNKGKKVKDQHNNIPP